MNTLFDEIEEKVYRGVSTDEYHQAIKDYSSAMFDLFDTDARYGSGNLGMHIMWLGSWTSKFIARDVVDYSIENNTPLNISLVEVLKKQGGGYGNESLDMIKSLLAKQ